MRGLGYVSWAVAAVLLTACGAPAGGGAEGDTFRILFVGGITGPQSAVIGNSLAGMRAAVDSINEDGGVGGRQIELDARDSQGNPTRAVSVLQEALTEDDRPDVVVPSPLSPEALAMVPLLTREEIVSVGFAASPLLNDPAQYPFHFQVSTNSAKQLVGLPDHLAALGVTTLAVLTAQDEFGNGIVRAAQAAVEGSGIQVVAQQFPPTDIDLSVSYARLLAESPQAVLLDVTGDPAPRLLQARVQAGATGIPTIIGSGMVATGDGPWAYGSPESNANVDYLVFGVSQFVPETERTPVFTDFYSRLTAAGPITQSISAPALAWDNIRIIAAAAGTPGATDSAQAMTDAIIALDEPAGYWLTQETFGYSADVHTPTPTADDFPFIPSGPLEEGLYRSVDAP